MGNIFKELGKLDDAEASYNQAIALKPDLAEAHSNRGKTLYANGNIDCAIESYEKAHEVDSSMKENELLLKILKSKRTRSTSIQNIDSQLGLNFNLSIQDRIVEADHISSLYEINSSSLDKAPGPRYGNGRCSPDYNLFNEDRSIIQTAKKLIITK